ncbi:MAG: 1-phosphofructokinase [Thermoanaerobacteraceae bacterium]|nr:1-phosphofructokinase [Thermoanaerobacteraceae bacterium]
MIATVTLNPAIDHTVYVERFVPCSLNRAADSEYSIGGKGINVSKVLAELGISSIALGFLGKNAGHISDELKEMGITPDFIEVPGNTRTNIKIIDRSNAASTEVNEPGPWITPEWLNELKERVLYWAEKCEYITFSGSLPQGLNEDIYKELIQIAKEKGARTILDADGESLRKGLESAPYMIKPNIHELKNLVGHPLDDEREVMNVCNEIISSGIEVVIVSMGSKGSIYADSKGVYRAYPLELDVKSTVGAGDAMVAGFLYAVDRGFDGESTARFAAASSSCRIISDFKRIREFYERIRIERWQ